MLGYWMQQCKLQKALQLINALEVTGMMINFCFKLNYAVSSVISFHKLGSGDV